MATEAGPRLRPATADDVGFLTDVSVAALQARGHLGDPDEEREWRAGVAEWTLAQVRGGVSESTTSVVEVARTPTGRLRVVRTADHLELAGIQLVARVQGRGLGSRLVGDLRAEARALGVPLRLSVEPDNPRAQALYERLGFEFTDRTGPEIAMSWQGGRVSTDTQGELDAEQLRALQRPLKERYREEPETAHTPLHAAATFTDPGVTATVDGWAGPVRAGLHAATGGDGSDACSGDMLLEALLACAGVTLRSVATAMSIPVRSASLTADGFFDARGTLGLDKTAPVGITDVVVTAELDTDAPDEQLTRLGELTERYCVVGQSLAAPPRIVVRRA